MCAVGNDSYTVLLIHSNSTDGSQTFENSAMGASGPVDAIGNVHHEIDQYHYGRTSIYFDGTGDEIQIASNDVQWAFGTGNFTIDLWVRPAAHNVAIVGNILDTDNCWHLSQNAAQHISFSYGSGLAITLSTGIALNIWTHLAVERHGNNFNTYYNGVKDATVGDLTGINFSTQTNLYVGGHADGTPTDFNGYMDEVRISKGIARYAGVNFKPPAVPYCDL